MEQLMRLNSQTSGRDKILRLWQFSCRLYWASMEKRSADKDVIKRIKDLEALIGLARRLLRFGRSLDMMYSSVSSLQIQDPFLRMVITSSKISSSLFLFADHLVWLKKVGLLRVDEKKWIETSNRFWLYSSLLNLIRDAHEINDLVKSENRRNLTCQPCGSVDYLSTVVRILIKHKSISVDTVKNVCDTLIPLANLGHVKVSPSKIGLLGIISSIAAMLQLINPSYRLALA